MSEKLGLSDLQLPFPRKKSPRAAASQRAAQAAAARSGLLDTAVTARRFAAFSSLPSHFFPEASEERLTACALFVNWLFFVDDVFDEDFDASADLAGAQRLMEEHLRILRTGALPREITALALYTLEVRGRLMPLFGSARYGRFCDTVAHYLLEGSLQAAANWGQKRVPDLDSYSSQREADGGSFTVIALIEVAADIKLAPSVLARPELARLRQLCARILSFVNDLCSYQKEVLVNGNPNNVVCVFMEHAGQPFESAVSTSVELINFLTFEFERLGERIKREEPALAPYVEGMEHLIQGNAHWSLDTGRYASPDSPFPELRRRHGFRFVGGSARSGRAARSDRAAHAVTAGAPARKERSRSRGA